MRVLLSFSSSTTLLGISSLLANFFVLRWLNPEELGVWQVFLLVQSACDLTRLGVVNGLNREYPLLLASEKYEQASRVANTASTFNSLSALLSVILHLSLIPYFSTKGFEFYFACIASAVSHYSLTRTSFLHGICRSSSNFAKLSSIQLVEAILIFLTLPLVAKFGLAGFCTRQALIHITVYALSSTIPGQTMKWMLDRRELLGLIKTGLPLYLTALLWAAGNSAERTLLISNGDLSNAGIYAAAFSILTAASLPNTAITQFLYPTLASNLGRGGDYKTLRRVATKYTLINLAVTTFTCLVAYLLAKPFFMHFAAEYANALPLIDILLCSGICLSFRSAATLFPIYKRWELHFSWVALFVIVKWLICLNSDQHSPNYLAQLAYSNTIAALAAAIVTSIILLRSNMRLPAFDGISPQS